MILGSAKKMIAWLILLFLQPVHSQETGNIEMQTFSNKYFSIELPTGWSVDESRKDLFLVSRENDKGLHITIFNVKDPNKPDSLKFSSQNKGGYQVLREEYGFHSGVGYKIFDGYKPNNGNFGFRSVELMLQNNNHLVYLSFGDYACLSQVCSKDIISGVENSFVVYDSENVPLNFQELIDQLD